MPAKLNIEVMIDTNANSYRMDKMFDHFREAAESEDMAQMRLISEFRDYLGKAGRRRGVQIEVMQRDTAQIFHEKTNLMTPGLAAQAGHVIKPDFLRENLEAGHYTVEPPVHGEEEYYSALEGFLHKILPEKAPQDMARLDAITPETRGLVLQELYLDHMAQLPEEFRKGPYEQAFRDYREVRFNAGEETALNFLRGHELPPKGEQTAFIFVGSDRWANEEMAKVRDGMGDEGQLEVFTVSPAKFRQLMTQVLRDVERDQPEMREVRKSYRSLRNLDAPDIKASARGMRRAAPDSEPTAEEAKAFSGFVMRLMQEQDAPSQERGR